VDNFGRTSLAWASMGLQSHRLDGKGPHAGSQGQIIGDLEDDVEDLAWPSLAKRFSQERQNILFLSFDIMFGWLGHGGEVRCIGT
jgi:hypothetical protein